MTNRQTDRQRRRERQLGGEWPMPVGCLDRNRYLVTDRKTETDNDQQTDRQTDRQRDRDRQTEKKRETGGGGGGTERNMQTDRTKRDRQTDGKRQTDKQRQKCSNNPYSLYSQDFFTVISHKHNQPSWTYELLQPTLQQNDCSSSSFPMILWPWVKTKVIQTGNKLQSLVFSSIIPSSKQISSQVSQQRMMVNASYKITSAQLSPLNVILLVQNKFSMSFHKLTGCGSILNFIQTNLQKFLQFHLMTNG